MGRRLVPPAFSPSHVFFSFLALRLINALSISTFFQPDEYFQALEPAWRLAFGPDSGAWITWEWSRQLRSSLHPVLFSTVYIAADRLGDLVPALRPHALLLGPRLLQAVFAAGLDWGTWRLATRIYGAGHVVTTVTALITAASPWQWYCSTRTFSNSLETMLTALTLAYFPWTLVVGPGSDPGPGSIPVSVSASERVREKEEEERRKRGGSSFGAGLPNPDGTGLRVSLVLAAFAVLLRPTNVLIWLVIYGRAVVLRPAIAVRLLVREAILCGSPVLAVSALSDRLFFGFWVFPPINWLYFNISQSLAVFYGRNNWHYFLSQGLPLLAASCLPFVVLGLWGGRPSRAVLTATDQRQQLPSSPPPPNLPARLHDNILSTLSAAVIATIIVLSFITHKEVRFIYPLLPMLHVLAAPYVVAFFTHPSAAAAAAAAAAASDASPFGAALLPRVRNKVYLINALLLNIVMAGYLAHFHQRAHLSVISFLRDEYVRVHPVLATTSPSSPPPVAVTVAVNSNHDKSPLYDDSVFVYFLTPCHTTPWRSHLLYPGLVAHAISCEPPLHTLPGSREREDYRDENDRFYDDPVHFLATELWPPEVWQEYKSKNVNTHEHEHEHGPRRTTPLPRYIVGFDGIEVWLRQFFRANTAASGEVVELSRVWEGWNGLFNEDWRRSGKLIVWAVDHRSASD